MQRTRPLALALLALALSPAVARADDPRIIVQHRPGLDASERAEIRADADTRLDHTLRLPDTEVVTVTDGTRAEAIAELRSDPDVVYAEADDRLQALTNDTYWPQLWGMSNPGTSGRVDADIDAEQAWTKSTGTGVTVGVVDTGVQANHPDLGGRVIAGFNTVTNTTDTTDGAGHGTHVAGIIGATADNGVGVAGIAPGATIQPLKVFTGQYAYESDIAEAFAYAGQHGVQVVNASLGGYGTTSPTIVSAMTTYPNTLYVIAAGNNGTNNDLYPVSPCVNSVANELCVGASTIDDTKASFSNYGASTVDLFAPGVGIKSTYPTSSYTPLDGASMATPYVAGTAALVASITSLRGAALAEQLKATVDRPAGLAGLSVTGGRLNAARAVGALPDPPSQPVVVSAEAGASSATLTMSGREADIASYLVYDAATGAYLTSATSPTIVVAGLGDGPHDFAVVARNTCRVSPRPPSRASSSRPPRPSRRPRRRRAGPAPRRSRPCGSPDRRSPSPRS